MATTDLITYNVNDRGRKFRGVDRFLDTVALARLINSGPVQEMVKHGDMIGYFGHWPREKFGLAPVEAGIINGQVVNLSPAVRTVELKADDSGNISHRQEFTSTNEGKIAARLYDSKVGGFSSAISPVPGTSPIIPKGFFGFDYVIEPNYTTNRGHKVILDGVMDAEAMEEMALLDSAAAQMSQLAGVMNEMFDSLHAQHVRALQAMEVLTRENEALIAGSAAGLKGQALLDSVSALGVAPLLVSPAEDYGRYKEMPLAQLSELDESSDRRGDKAFRSTITGYMRRLGVK